MIYFQALSQHFAGEISANHENVCVMNPLSETRLEKRTSRCWSRNSNHFTEILEVYMEMNERIRVYWIILLHHMWGSNALRLYSHDTTTKQFRMRWHHSKLINMKGCGQVITQLAVLCVRFWNGVDIFFYVHISVHHKSMYLEDQRDAVLSTLCFTAKSLYMFRVSPAPIIRSTQTVITSHKFEDVIIKSD